MPVKSKPYRIDLTGHRYGQTTVIGYERRDGKAHHLWLCLCDCGREHVARGNNLRTGNTTSCGCQHSGGRPVERHGHHASPTYSTWEHLIDRCTNPNNKKFPLYGGVGVSVCDRWRSSFEAFLEDMGERPKGKSIDRIDPDGDYEPDNCRWATVKEQNRNLRTVVRVEYQGEVVPLVELAEKHGRHINTVKGRLSRGWPLQEALATPPRASP